MWPRGVWGAAFVGAALTTWTAWPQEARAACPTAYDEIITAAGEEACVPASTLRTRRLLNAQRLREKSFELRRQLHLDRHLRSQERERRRQRRSASPFAP